MSQTTVTRKMLTCGSTRKAALLQTPEFQAILPVLQEFILLVAPPALKTEPASALRLYLIRTRTRTTRDGERLC